MSDAREVRLVKDELLAVASQLEKHLEQLALALHMSNTAVESMNLEEAREHLRVMGSLQAQMLEMREEACRAVRVQAAIHTMQQQRKEAQAAITAYARATAHAKNLIQVARHEVDPVLEANKKAKHDIDIEECIAFAKRISITSMAPPRWEDGMPMGIFLPPRPGEEQMATSILYRDFEELVQEELGLKKPHTEGSPVVAAQQSGSTTVPPSVGAAAASSSTSSSGVAAVSSKADMKSVRKPAVSLSLFDSDTESESDSDSD